MNARTGTVTVLFTDLVGSTALRSALDEERSDVLRRTHDTLLQSCVAAQGGVVVKGGGDGIMATFDAAANGLAAAVAMQQELARHNARPDRLAELAVRIGLSTGDVTWEDGDCFGLPVVEAARLEAAAEGGQILCSELVRLMARGRGAHEFEPVGFLHLKGLAEPVAACIVRWTPPSAGPGTPGALPVELAVEVRGARFVGRGAELEAIGRLLDAEPARAAVAWVLGEPGAGKTRLAAELARTAHRSGATVLFGRCSEDLTVPYQPFLDALRSFLGTIGDDPSALGPTPGELVRLLPEIGERFPALRPVASANNEVEQYRLFEAVRGWLAAASAQQPVVFVVDDVHWAGPQTLQLLGHIARSAEPSRVRFVCTARDTAPDANEALADLVTDLQRASVPSAAIELRGLERDDVGELAAAMVGRVDAALVDRLHRDAAGNPLLVTSVLAAHAVWAADGEQLPHSVQDLVRRRVRALPPELTELLRVAAFVGLEFELPVVAHAAQLDGDRVLDHLEHARLAGLVLETGFDRYRFTHALVRAALRTELGESRRIRTHLRIARALESVVPGRVDELAHHFWEAAATGCTAEAYRYNRAAAVRAEGLLSYRDAADLYRRALSLAPDEDRAELLLARGVAEHNAGEMISGLAVMLEAAGEARRTGRAELLARVALTMDERSWQPAAFSAEVAALCDEALRSSRVGAPDAIRLRASMARAQAYDGRATQVLDSAWTALADADQLGDPSVIAHCVIRVALNRAAWDDRAQLEELVGRLAVVHETAEDDIARLDAVNLLCLLSTRLGDLHTVEHHLAHFQALAAPLRQPFWVLGPNFYRCGLDFAAGDLATAERSSADAARLTEQLQGAEHAPDAVRTFQLRREQGRLGEIEPALRLLLRLNSTERMWQPGLAITFASLGWHDEATAVLDRIDVGALPHDALRDLALCFLAETIDAVGGHPLAAAVHEALLPGSGLNVMFGFGLLSPGPVDRFLGLVAAVLGRHGDADRYLGAAVAAARRMDAPLFLTHTLADHGRWCRRRGDEARAGALLAEATSLAVRHGLTGLAARLAPPGSGVTG